MTIPYAVMALEYCLLTGVDYWDILIGLRSTMLDSLCERLNENFNQQSSAIQQMLQYKLLNIKLAIYRYIYCYVTDLVPTTLFDSLKRC